MTFKGRIDIIMGCMFSGKSTECIRLINRHRALKRKVLVINHNLDNRYKENSIVTHNKESLSCFAVNDLHLIKSDPKFDYKNSDVILIEEAQFFTGLFDFVTNAADKDNKTVIVSGLDGDSNRQEFGDILKLIPHCDKVIKLHALCLICGDGTPACFTKRTVDDSSQILVGVNQFIPVCRKHYLVNK